MIELVVGLVAGLLLAGWAGLDGATTTVAAGLGLVVGYLAWCRRLPQRVCWWPWHSSTVSEGRNYRRRVCWWCKGVPRRRLGARLIGRGR